MTQFSFQRLDDGKSWGIKASGNIDQAHKYAGETVTVRKADGSTQEVKLGARITAWNANRAAVYAIERAPRPTRAPAPFVDQATRECLEDDAHEIEYELMTADAYRWAAFFAERLLELPGGGRVLERLANIGYVDPQLFATAREAVEAAREAVADEIASMDR